MTSRPAPQANLDVRRRRILFRCWHRGTREMDLILGRFADAALAGLTDAELDACERLLEVPDPELFSWIVGSPLPADHDTPVFHKLRAFHGHVGTLDA
jgi:antitoxin CptB